MLTRSHHRFARRANRDTAPDAVLSRLARRTSQFLVAALLMTGLNLGGPAIRPALAAAQPPIGYERWTVADADSGVDYGLTTKQVFQKYAQPMVAPGLTPTDGTKDNRLIDIEVRVKDGDNTPPDALELADYVFDVVWVKNEDHFTLESWFVPELTEDELHVLPQLAPQGIVAADIERYPEGNEWRYAAILQRNAGHFGWQVLTDAPWDEVHNTYERHGLRLLDLDYVVKGPLSCSSVPQGQACAEATFDAILVANSGSNHIETRPWFDMSPAQIADKQAQGWQMIDREVGGPVATVWVKSGRPFEVLDDLSQNEVIFEHGHHGRVVDLERTGTSYAIVRFAGSGAPVSPELSNPRQGDKDDGKHKVKSHKGDKHKAKHHKGGKGRGKGKHRR